MTAESALRRSIVEVGRLLYAQGLVIATDGNISVRLDRQRVLISPAGFCKGLLSESDIACVAVASGNRETRTRPSPGAGSAPSSETPMHLAVYRKRPDISAVIHAHPPYATSFAVSGQALDSSLLPETRMFDGPVGRVAYTPPGSDRLARSVAASLTRHNFCLLARHGAVAVGANILEAFYRLERLEFLARVTWLART